MGIKKLLPAGFLILILILSACGSDDASSSDGASEEFPNKTVEFLVAAGPGGGTDNFARQIQRQLGEQIDEDITVKNMEAASGALAHENTANSDPDGHTLDFASTTYIINVAAGQGDVTLDEITPVARLQADILNLFVNPDKYDSLDEFLEKAENEGVLIGGTHAASPDEMAFLELKRESGLNMEYIPYDGSGNAHANLLGGNVDAIFDELGSVLDYVEVGDMKPILTFAEERLSEYQDVATTVDQGWDLTNGNERGVFVNADTPEETITEIESLLKDIYDSEEYKEYAENNHLHYRGGWLGAEEYREKLQKDLESYQELLAE